MIGELGVAAPPGPDGAPRMLPLSQLATLEVVEGPAPINRERISRRIRVDANVRGRDLASFVEEEGCGGARGGASVRLQH